MGATRWEYRFRFALHALIYTLGFWSPWAHYLPGLGLTTRSTWLVLAAELGRGGWLTFSAATSLLLVLAIVLTGLGAAFRFWGAAYVGARVVHSDSMHGERLLADGPYRRTRNPLYLGTLLHTIGVSLLMPPSGAVFAIVLLWILQLRLALAEEPFLTQRFGAAYAEYARRVPRFLPAPKPLLPAGGRQPLWLQALVGELYFVGVFVALLAFGWSFNLTLIYRSILIVLGASLIVRAVMPPLKSEETTGPIATP